MTAVRMGFMVISVTEPVQITVFTTGVTEMVDVHVR